MKHRLALIALAGLIAAPAFSGTCGPEQAADVALLETAKAALLNADYQSFTSIAGPYFPDLAENYDGYFGPLETTFPEGFDRCVTILQRREAPSFAQDLIFYFPKGYDSPMAVLLIAADVEGTMRMIEFSYNTNISGVLDELK
ncbi:hypothetical protein [Boseongicola aestuarii]|jgi:hypothetical protein|uniref:DUF3887 domain-containing protein n=1 Tax=Boseongicola aestuarii TaxID=1470561 RepID=A0A238IXU0_9RHOB|nr:hypothetical protein [Boseongicola aestuarii]SMX22802.1 hypothetical protein BOA8489_00900 [Boseongicola aestuarii]